MGENLDQESLDQESLDQENLNQESLDQEELLSQIGSDVLILQSSGGEIDYTDLLESIDSRLETLESITIPDNTTQINEIRDNSYRLYYFIGGLYVAFAIVMAIKLLKIFF